MLRDSRAGTTLLVLAVLLALSAAFTLNLPVIYQGFLAADQAVYYAMAQSVVHDGDLEFAKMDLMRYKDDFDAGPVGVFLKKAGDGRILYAKSPVYSIFAAPFVYVLGPNGPLVFHALLFALILLMGRAYFRLDNDPNRAVLRVLTFLLASVAWIYFLWIAQDFFVFFLVFAALFLWLYKSRFEGAAGNGDGAKPPGAGRLRAFLLSGGSEYLAGFLAGIAAYAKPPNVAVLGPILLFALLKKRFGRAVLILGFFLLAVGLLVGANRLLTGQWDWNYQGGERKTFAYAFPGDKNTETWETLTFDTAGGFPMTSEGYFNRALRPLHFIPLNLFYYVFGRFNGLAWYFFPACLFGLLFLIGRKSLRRWLLFVALAGEILIYVVLMPDNFGGGGGSIANRYFLGIYPFFFFLPEPRIRRGETAACWAMAAIFLSTFYLAPFGVTRQPSMQAKRFPFTVLPVELTNINNLQSNTNPYAMQQQWGVPFVPGRFLFFLNDNFHRKHPTEDGWWTVGDRTADIVLKTYYPIREVAIKLLNNPRHSNLITIWVDGEKKTITLGENERGELRFEVGTGFKILDTHLHRIRIRAAKGARRYYEERRSDEKRWLGVFFTPEVVRR